MKEKRNNNNTLYLWDLKFTIFTDILILTITLEGSTTSAL